MSNVLPFYGRSAVASRGMIAAISARQDAGVDPYSPVSIYDFCDAVGIVVRFNDIATLEGMYQRGSPPRIHLSALRPLARRAYSCAHELGHHLLGHSSTVHELRSRLSRSDTYDPTELLADAFAGFLLMPALGLRRAFADRGTTANEATSHQVYAIACDYGVGYSTLVNHLAYGSTEIPRSRASALLRVSPKTLRADLLGMSSSDQVVYIDHFSRASLIDAEVGSVLLLPRGTKQHGQALTYERDIVTGSLFRAVQPGISQIFLGGSRAIFSRISRFQYCGLARYRHLEDIDDG